jgi:uncharacterized integral membrane protein
MLREERSDMGGLKYVFVAVLASAITVFALQNGTPTTIRFLFWSVDGASLATIILLSAAAGIALVGVPLVVERWRLRSQLRTLETRLAVLKREPEPPRDPTPPRTTGGTP